MSETHWVAGAVEIELSSTTWLAQTFIPLWSHDCHQVRFNAKITLPPCSISVSIQYLNPVGWPTGIPLTEVLINEWSFPSWNAMHTFQLKVPSIRLVAGIKYAMVLKVQISLPLIHAYTSYVPPPTGYTKGWLLHSIDAGHTWQDTPDGCLLFAEFGDPPLAPSEFVAPIRNWTIQSLEHVDYFVST